MVEVVEKFDVLVEAQSKYEVEDGSIILMRYMPTRFKLTRQHNSIGEPVISCEADVPMEVLKPVAPTPTASARGP